MSIHGMTTKPTPTVVATAPEQRVDQSALKFNQGMIVTLLIIAFLFDQSWLVAFVTAVMAIGTMWPAAGLFKNLYSRLIRPLGLLQPQIVLDDPNPHLFAQGLGAVVLAVALLLFVAGLPLAAWVLVGVVVVLAAINLLFAFCVGCFLYFQLVQRGIRPTLAHWHKG